LADYQNLEKRFQREKEEFTQFANTNLLLKLIIVLDHFERAQAHLKDPGLDLALKELKKILQEEGLVEIEALGKEFNPLEMEAVAIIEGSGKDNEVAEVLAKGYSLKGKTVRPAKVKVIKFVNK
ncbi:MAG: nucleotide exchange factor GrpE, partial [Patescibacteria group bacterium]|nr:nucleotide exchange factor GrpE [Patescibacteria group bacterium]